MKTIIGIMGGGEKASQIDKNNAYELGRYIASKGFVTLTGGRNIGVMNEALRGAKENSGITLGILPNDDKESFSEYLDIPVITNMRSGRNYINALSSDLLIICGVELGTSSEISLGLKAGKKVILVGLYKEANIFYKKLAPEQVYIANNYDEAIKHFNTLI
ncbi:MAG: cytochrome [Candidatus Gracilibacteria bacterium]|nr:cytochrome [Candidatus Gracilibacteria bacterium]